MDLMRLNGLIRRAINLVKGVDVAITEETFEMAITSIIPWFKVSIPLTLFLFRGSLPAESCGTLFKHPPLF